MADRADNPAEARTLLKRLNAWLHERVRLLGAGLDVEELDAEGLSQFLPDDVENEVPPSPDAAAEGERNEPAPDIPVTFRPYKPDYTRGAALGEAAEGEGEEPLMDGDEPLGEDEAEDDGDGEGQGEEGGNDGKEEASTDGEGGGPTPRRVGLRKVRVFCVDESAGRYRVICEPEESGTGFLRVRVIGEVGQDAAPVKAFSIHGGTAQKPPRPGVVGPLELQKSVRLELDVVLDDALHCALGVTAHAS